jgi:hypothetical protein
LKAQIFWVDGKKELQMRHVSICAAFVANPVNLLVAQSETAGNHLGMSRITCKL